MICQLIGQGSHADQWVKDSYQDFRQLMLATLPSTFYAETAMITRIAQDYQTNFRNHIASNFERNCTNYFFLRLNNDADPWYVANATVKERKSIAAYIYKRAASLQSTWPDIENEEILQNTFDERVRSISLGPIKYISWSRFHRTLLLKDMSIGNCTVVQRWDTLPRLESVDNSKVCKSEPT